MHNPGCLFKFGCSFFHKEDRIMKTKIKFTLNHKPVEMSINSELKLLWILRTRFGLTGTKYACGDGYCGSCTVLINNQAERSCQVSLKEVEGKDVVTIEGLSKDGDLHPLQKSFIEHDALQCGYCTPGMILTAVSFLKKNPNPTRTEIISEMDDNLCRCGSYIRIVDAIQSAAAEMEEG
jgi:aerobic-type carbon monoxide dehydrogenase small subunit (CoxS/CutS family)